MKARVKKSSWTARPSRTFRGTIMRKNAAEHADKFSSRGSPGWQDRFDDFISGWVAGSRSRNATIRVKVEPVR